MGALVLGIIMVLIGWLVFDSVLFICAVILAYIFLHTYFFTVKRKSFFRITVEK